MTASFNPESYSPRKKIKNRHVLIDADCVSYWAAGTCNNSPERVALRRVDQRMEQIIDTCQAEKVTNYLTGEGNFRDDIATLQRYKGNRYLTDGTRITPRPKWLQECREYICEAHSGIMVNGQEADDALSIHRARYPWHDNDHIISSIDKDLRINVGYHHNQNTGAIIKVAPVMTPLKVISSTSLTTKKVTKKVVGVGHMFFWYQMLAGDTADYIKGLPGITPAVRKCWPQIHVGGCGPLAAARILSRVQSESQARDCVWFCYKHYWGSHGYKHWRTGEEYAPGMDTAYKQFLEQGRLLWMRTKENELWEPKNFKRYSTLGNHMSTRKRI